MASLVEFKDVTYYYPEAEKPALSSLNLTINEGEFVLIKGSSGCGKSTLLRCINGLVPHYSGGTFQGKVVVNGFNPLDYPVEEMSKHVGLLFQDPENQISCTRVVNEIAFGLENVNLLSEKIGERISEIASQLGIRHLLERKTNEISSGEKQKIVLASLLAMEPKILLLDEPSSQLDPESTVKLNKILFDLNEQNKTTIVLVEHDFTETHKVDKIIDLGKAELPVNEKSRKQPGKRSDVILKASHIDFSYGKKKVLGDITLQVNSGEFVSIIGANGSGKTTLLKHFNGLLKPERGSILIDNQETRNIHVEELARTVGFLSQNPNDYLFCDTVADELNFTLRNLDIDGDVDSTLEKFDLIEHKNSYPRDLSGGERQRVALASILIAKPKIVVLDEPTRGIDSSSKKKLLEIFNWMKLNGKTIVVATHNMDLASHSDRVILLDKGKIIKDDVPERILR